MPQRAGDRRQGSRRGQRDGAGVDEEGGYDVGPHLPHHLPHQAKQVGKALDLVAHQDGVRGLHRDVAADPAHRDAGIGAAQGQGVVHPVPDHAGRLAPVLVLLDYGRLLLRQQVGADVRDPRGGRGRAGGPLVVPREEHAGDAGGLQRADRVPRLRPYRVREGDHPDDLAAVGEADDRGPLAEVLVRRLGGPIEGRPQGGEVVRLPDGDLRSVDPAAHGPAGDRMGV